MQLLSLANIPQHETQMSPGYWAQSARVCSWYLSVIKERIRLNFTILWRIAHIQTGSPGRKDICWRTICQRRALSLFWNKWLDWERSVLLPWQTGVTESLREIITTTALSVCGHFWLVTCQLSRVIGWSIISLWSPTGAQRLQDVFVATTVTQVQRSEISLTLDSESVPL